MKEAKTHTPRPGAKHGSQMGVDILILLGATWLSTILAANLVDGSFEAPWTNPWTTLLLVAPLSAWLVLWAWKSKHLFVAGLACIGCLGGVVPPGPLIVLGPPMWLGLATYFFVMAHRGRSART